LAAVVDMFPRKILFQGFSAENPMRWEMLRLSMYIVCLTVIITCYKHHDKYPKHESFNDDKAWFFMGVYHFQTNASCHTGNAGTFSWQPQDIMSWEV
jgi:hypothetical protein